MAKREPHLSPTQWRIFVAMCEYLSSEGAVREGTAVMRYICGKELADGSPLFSRTLKSIANKLGLEPTDLIDDTFFLTDRARTYWHIFSQQLELHEQAKEMAKAGARTGLTVATSTTLATYVLPLVMRMMRYWKNEREETAVVPPSKDRAAQLDMRVVERDWGEWNTLLARDPRVGFIFTPMMDVKLPGTEYIHLRSLDYQLLYQRARYAEGSDRLDHYRRRPGDLKSEFLASMPVIHLPREAPNVDFNKLLPRPRGRGRRIEVPHHSVLRAWVDAGLGVGISYELPKAAELQYPRTDWLPINHLFGGQTLSLGLYLREPQGKVEDGGSLTADERGRIGERFQNGKHAKCVAALPPCSRALVLALYDYCRDENWSREYTPDVDDR